MRKAKAMLVVAAFVVIGCGGPRFDATNKDTISASLKSMGEGMNEAQKKEFKEDVLTLTLSSLFRTGLNGAMSRDKEATKPDSSEMMRSLNGMTVAQIHDAAEKLRAEIKARPAGKKP